MVEELCGARTCTCVVTIGIAVIMNLTRHIISHVFVHFKVAPFSTLAAATCKVLL